MLRVYGRYKYFIILVRGSSLDVIYAVFRRQILSSRDGPRTKRVKAYAKFNPHFSLGFCCLKNKHKIAKVSVVARVFSTLYPPGDSE